MQRALTHVDFLINSSLSASERKRKIDDYARYVETNPAFNGAHKNVLYQLIAYAKKSLTSNSTFSTTDTKRYNTYNSIIKMADALDAMHFNAFVNKELNKISDNTSSLRDDLLPTVNRNIEILLAPTVVRTKNGISVSTMAFGFASLLFSYVSPTGAAAAGLATFSVGLIGYLASAPLAQIRLDDSLNLKEHALLTGGADNTALLQDGLQDKFIEIEKFTNGLWNSTATMFQHVARVPALIPLGRQPQMLLAGAGGHNQVQAEREDDRARVVIKK